MANSIAEGNQHTLLVRVESSCSLQTKRSSGLSLGLQLLEGSSSPAVFRLLAGSLNQNPICLYFLFSAGSPCGSSFDDRAACSCARVSKPASLCLHTFAGNTWNVSLCALLHLQAQKLSDRRRRRRGNNLRCSLLPAPSASLCSAQPRSVKPQIIHSLGYETEEEGETEGGNARETRSSTHSGTDKL